MAVLVFYSCHKKSPRTQWLKRRQIYYLTVLEVRNHSGLGQFFSSSSTKAKLASGKEFASTLMQVVVRIQFLITVQLKSLFPSWLSAGGCIQLLEANLLCLVHRLLHLRASNDAFNPYAWNLTDFLFGLSLISLPPEKILCKGSCDQIGLTQIIQDNVPILKSITQKYLQVISYIYIVPRIRMQISFGGQFAYYNDNKTVPYHHHYFTVSYEDLVSALMNGKIRCLNIRKRYICHYL